MLFEWICYLWWYKKWNENEDNVNEGNCWLNSRIRKDLFRFDGKLGELSKSGGFWMYSVSIKEIIIGIWMWMNKNIYIYYGIGGI